MQLEHAELRRRGLSGDRRWMVVDEEGRFLTQRSCRALVTLRSELTPGGVRLNAPDVPALNVSMPDGRARQAVQVWGDTVQAADAGEEAANWLSAYLRLRCRLVFMDEQARRPVDAPAAREGDEVSFADAMPVLLTNQASLDALSDLTGRPLEMARFRPNLVVDGGQAWEEDGWSRLRIGGVEFVVTHPCQRCVVTTLDPQTGAPSTDHEPLRTLGRLTRGVGVCFGLNLLPRATGLLRRGDSVELLE